LTKDGIFRVWHLQTGLPELQGVLSKKSNGAFGSWQKRFFKVRAGTRVSGRILALLRELSLALGVLWFLRI
jgi:hypothetical protein